MIKLFPQLQLEKLSLWERANLCSVLPIPALLATSLPQSRYAGL
jgi:hypothetical protein